jgi:hypothetical protein
VAGSISGENCLFFSSKENVSNPKKIENKAKVYPIEEFQNISMASERSFREGGMLQRVIGAIFFVCVI